MKVTFDAKTLQAKLRKLAQGVVETADMKAIGADVLGNILHDVQKEGRGVDGGQMPPYTPAYAAWRSGRDLKQAKRNFVGPLTRSARNFKAEKSNRKFIGPRSKSFYRKLAGGKYQTNYRDLTVTGQMLGNMNIIAAGKDSVILGFPDTQQEKKARGNQKIYKWFGVSSKSKKMILDRIKKKIKKSLGEG